MYKSLKLQDAVTPLSEAEAIDLVKTVFVAATERDIYTVSFIAYVGLSASPFTMKLVNTLFVIFYARFGRETKLKSSSLMPMAYTVNTWISGKINCLHRTKLLV